jgi:hypothetical protein
MAAPWGRGCTIRGAEAGQPFLAETQGLGYWTGLESANVCFWPYSVEKLDVEMIFLHR